LKGWADVGWRKQPVKDWQKLELCDVVNVVADQRLDFAAVRALQRREAAHVEWLQQVE
jgi:hypothetical protein